MDITQLLKMKTYKELRAEEKQERRKTVKYYWQKIIEADNVADMASVLGDLYLDRNDMSIRQSLNLRMSAKRKMDKLVS